MAITPETLPRHELVGLHAEVVEATSPDYVGIAGEVVEETTATLRIAADDRARTVPKRVATIAFELPDCGERIAGRRPSSDGQSDAGYAVVEGGRLVARPARRTEHGGTLWHSD